MAATGLPALAVRDAELPPGPRLPGIAQTLRYTFDQPRFFAENRARYGRSWTLRMPGFPPAVVTTDRDAIRRLFTGDPLTKRHGNDLLRPIFGDRSLLLLEPAEHLTRRRIELPPFHGEAIAGYRERVAELVAQEVASWSGTIETHPRARALTLSIILELVLGIRDRGVRDQIATIMDAFDTPLQNLAQFLPQRLTRRSNWNPMVRAPYARLDRLRELVTANVPRAREAPGADVVSMLVHATDDRGVPLSDEDLRDELVTLVIGGHETTATAIAWACDLLAHHPAVLLRLREGDSAYLKATAKEVLRARTVAYLSAARYPLEPFPVGEWVLPAGVSVLVDAQGVHGDPEVHPEPDAFRPERFLDDPPDSYAYIPFGGGAHRCLGSALAMLELETVLAEIARSADLEPDGPPATPVRRGITLVPGNAGRVRVTRPGTPAAGTARAAPASPGVEPRDLS